MSCRAPANPSEMRFFRSSTDKGSAFATPCAGSSATSPRCKSASTWLSTATAEVANPATKPLNSTFGDFPSL